MPRNSSSSIPITSLKKSNISNDFFGYHGWFAFIVLCVLYGSATYIAQRFVMTEQVYYNSLGEQLTVDRIQEILKINSALTWVQVLILPVFALLQVLTLSFAFNVGALLAAISLDVKQIFLTILKATLIFGLAKIIQACLCLVLPIQTIDDVAKSDIFSVNGWLAILNIPVHELLTYPLTLVSVVEIAFCLLLTAAFRKFPMSDAQRKRIPIFVWGTYCLTLTIWTLVVLFLQVNLG